MKKFVINKTLATLLFKNGYVSIERGGFVPLSAEDVSTAEFVDAERRQWIDISDKEPKSVQVPAVETVSIQSPIQGMTADELKAELDKGPANEYTAVVEALGAGEPAGASSEAIVEALGRDSTVEVTPGTEEAAKPAAKTARKAK